MRQRFRRTLNKRPDHDIRHPSHVQISDLHRSRARQPVPKPVITFTDIHTHEFRWSKCPVLVPRTLGCSLTQFLASDGLGGRPVFDVAGRVVEPQGLGTITL